MKLFKGFGVNVFVFIALWKCANRIARMTVMAYKGKQYGLIR